jgi:hypothetical protein
MNVLLNTIASGENGGIVAFASSKGEETSIESSAWKNGAFTKALVEGVEQGRAAAFGGDAITTSMLDAFLPGPRQRPHRRRAAPRDEPSAAGSGLYLRTGEEAVIATNRNDLVSVASARPRCNGGPGQGMRGRADG